MIQHGLSRKFLMSTQVAALTAIQHIELEASARRHPSHCYGAARLAAHWHVRQ